MPGDGVVEVLYMPADAVGRLLPGTQNETRCLQEGEGERESSVLQTTPTKLDGLKFLPLAPSAAD